MKLPKKPDDESYNNLELEVTALKEKGPLKIKIVCGTEKNKVIERILQTAKNYSLESILIKLADLTEDTEELIKDVIIIDDVDFFIFQPPLGRLSLQKKLEKFLDELKPGSGKLLVFGFKAEEALNYFKGKFKALHSEAEIIDIR